MIRKISLWIGLLVLSLILVLTELFFQHQQTEVWLDLNPEWQTSGQTVPVHFRTAGKYIVTVLSYPKTGSQFHWHPLFKLVQLEDKMGGDLVQELSPLADHDYEVEVGGKLEQTFKITYSHSTAYEDSLGVEDKIENYGKAQLRFRIADVPVIFSGIFYGILALMATSFFGVFLTTLLKLLAKDKVSRE